MEKQLIIGLNPNGSIHLSLPVFTMHLKAKVSTSNGSIQFIYSDGKARNGFYIMSQSPLTGQFNFYKVQ